MISPERARRDLPVLQRNLDALGKLSSKVFDSKIKMKTRGHVKFMLVSFAVKQIEHSHSLLRLNSSVDTVLIARSMLEGLTQLLWALKESRGRPIRWRVFPFILDWRLMQRQHAQGLSIDPVVQQSIRAGVRRYGKWFLNQEAKRALAAGQPLQQDPYVRNWYGEREADIFRDVGGALLYESAYGPFSEWHHWRPGAFGRLLSYDEKTSTFIMTTADPNQVAMALATGFQCLWQTMRLFNTRCRLGIGRDLQDLRRKHIALGKRLKE
jgi:Family of unknown function (DUF5677)